MKSLIFKPWKAQAIHESNPDIEWQTRRLIKPQPIPIVSELKEHSSAAGYWIPYSEDRRIVNNNPGSRKDDCGYYCPYSIGEQVYIKESFKYIDFCLLDIGELHPRVKVEYKADNTQEWVKGDVKTQITIPDKWRPSIFMPAWAARTVVTITGVGAQRVQDISEDDAIAEGLVHNAFWDMWESPLHSGSLIDWYKTAFKQLWDSMHGPGSWERNDWVWKYSFIRRGYETTESHRDTSSY